MVHTIQNLKTSNLNPDFEFQQLLVSLKHVIDLVMWIRDIGCHSPPPKNKISIRDLKGEGPKGTVNNHMFPPYGSSKSGW
jgi:hypothetical protein